MSIGDVLDGSFRALRATFATAAVLVLLVHGPYQLLSSLAFARLVPELDDLVGLEQTIVDPVAGFELMARVASVGTLSGLVGVVVNVVIGAAVVWCVLQVDRGETPAVAAALRTAVSRIGATLGGSLVLLVAGGLALGFTAIVFVVLFAVALPLGVLIALPVVPLAFLVFAALFYLIPAVAVVEGNGPLLTLQRVLWVLGRRFWRVIGVTFLISLLVSVITLGLGLGLGFLAQLSGGFGWVVEAATNTLVALISVPLTVIAALLVYLDARIRIEGYDLELRAGGAAAR